MKGTRPLDNDEIRKVSVSGDFRMSVKYLFATLAILLVPLTFFALDTLADTEYTYDNPNTLIVLLVIFFIAIGIAILANLLAKKKRTFLKVHSSQLSSEDPKELLELAEKCNKFLKDTYSGKISNLARQAKDKATKIQQAKEETERIQRKIVNLETFKSEISEDGSHPAVVATLKETMHNPDSFQHVSSDYETVDQEGKSYQKIVMTFRGRNTFNALVLQTCYFLVDADNQISLVGSPDDTESSPVNTAAIAASADAAASAVEGVATLADLLSFFQQ